MTRREPVFFSFHFDNDVMRAQMVRQMGAIEGNEPTSPNDWESIKRKSGAVERWIDDNMKHKRCVIVLIGEETANRPWVKYEIEKAWKDKRGLFGIYIHNLRCAREVRAGRSGTCRKGVNPFQQFSMQNGGRLSDYVTCHEPGNYDAYNTIANSMQSWVQAAIADAQRR